MTPESKTLAELEGVNERSAEELEAQKAALALKFALIDLTANLLRIVGGAGKPHRVIDQIDGLQDIINEYINVCGRDPERALVNELRCFAPEESFGLNNHDEAKLETAICRDALDVIASSLLDEKIQRDRAAGNFRAGLRAFVDLRERRKRRGSLRGKAIE
jgi:hypothetical protein